MLIKTWKRWKNHTLSKSYKGSGSHLANATFWWQQPGSCYLKGFMESKTIKLFTVITGIIVKTHIFCSDHAYFKIYILGVRNAVQLVFSQFNLFFSVQLVFSSQFNLFSPSVQLVFSYRTDASQTAPRTMSSQSNPYP